MTIYIAAYFIAHVIIIKQFIQNISNTSVLDACRTSVDCTLVQIIPLQLCNYCFNLLR